ncbi:MAG: 50S ribosomal protein L21e [Candidatus Nanoarchaeia archaeon]|nr:50S ribosomal protein L21e [Candidatus Nanoarchaeia archaeon]
MAQRIGGFRRKTRYKLQKKKAEKGRIVLRKFLQEFKEGDKVYLKADPAYQKGMYFPRFHGKSGIIRGKKGGCYNVMIKDGNKQKEILIHPVHLKRVQ